MRFIKELIEELEENSINFFTEEKLENRLDKKGYKEKVIGYKNKKESSYIKTDDESIYFSKDKLNRSLNKIGFKNDRDRKVWYRNEEGKKALGITYMNKLETLGFDRYCSDDDEYIDEPREKIDDIYLPYGLIEELEDLAKERGLTFESSLELILLEYLAYRKKSKERHLKNIIESLEDNNYGEEEIKYITNKYKKDRENFIDTDICYYLDDFYLKYFKDLNFTNEQLEILKKEGKDDVEFLQACYYGATHYNKTDFESLRIFYENNFRETDTYYLEKAKKEIEQMGLTDKQILYLTSQNSNTLIEEFSELVDKYKLKTFEDIKELYKNEFFITNNLFFKYLKAIKIKENEIDILKSYINPKMKKEEQENILYRVFNDIKKFKVSEFVLIERWLKEAFKDEESENEEEKIFREKMDKICIILDEKL